MPKIAKRLIVAMTGASGAALGVELLKVMKGFPRWETHLVVSAGAEQTLRHECDLTLQELSLLATHTYDVHDIGAGPASGTFRAEGMVVVPCSMKTTAGIAHGFADNLILRAADVTIKQRRPLVLVTREAPLSPIHLQNMLALAHLGVVILPPVLTFYHQPATIDDMVRMVLGKVLDVFNLELPGFERWGEQ
ncbi:UbiX family flavin prenyltransferase [Paradesulfitobacterium ferrireducens]|uniref:UbiX family flavin prenyltransferase n=1 Tax=Paradesulfitobacterium ferrireducens TaxID=2816476 RepID=UPI001A8D60A6|nr:UbiX family flavin prenyltransferase [Paradesulfitobacterium ferrireducens]